jgi:NADH-quinone oxidoreductase subunit G
MPNVIMDGKPYTFEPGEKIIELAQRVGVVIPYYCYHPGLSVVAQCRMCAVQIEKMPKLQTACSTPLIEGMVIHTQTPAVKEQQQSVMEFLLVNHPLDCAICDQSGECDLQDYSYIYGRPGSRSQEPRRTYMDADMGPVIAKSMNRCIHCTRCIRFGEEVAGIREMVALARGNETEITTLGDLPLQTPYAGNYADICPVGSLTLKDFRFKKRVWFLKSTESICQGCSKGCHLFIHHHEGAIERQTAKSCKEVNGHWICDEGRFLFRQYQTETRVLTPLLDGKEVEWGEAFKAFRAWLAKKPQVLVGTDCTQEEIQALQEWCKLQGLGLQFFSGDGCERPDEDKPLDHLLRRSSKTANLHGVHALGVEPFSGKVSGPCLVVSMGRAVVPDLDIGASVLLGVDLLKSNYHLVLPTPGLGEKSGTVLNHEGRAQTFQQAIPAPEDTKTVPQFLMEFTHSAHSKGAA